MPNACATSPDGYSEYRYVKATSDTSTSFNLGWLMWKENKNFKSLYPIPTNKNILRTLEGKILTIISAPKFLRFSVTGVVSVGLQNRPTDQNKSQPRPQGLLGIF